jgi:hypothetical protein
LGPSGRKFTSSGRRSLSGSHQQSWWFNAINYISKKRRWNWIGRFSLFKIGETRFDSAGQGIPRLLAIQTHPGTRSPILCSYFIQKMERC